MKRALETNGTATETYGLPNLSGWSSHQNLAGAGCITGIGHLIDLSLASRADRGSHGVRKEEELLGFVG